MLFYSDDFLPKSANGNATDFDLLSQVLNSFDFELSSSNSSTIESLPRLL